MRTNILIAVVVIVVACIFAYYNSRYVLADDDQVVITQFGKAIGAKSVPGEYFKIPVVQKVHYITKKYYLTEWTEQIPTKDKKFVNLKTKSFWQISDPIQYYKMLNSYNLAKDFIMDQVGKVTRNFVISHAINELVTTDGLSKIENVECNHGVVFGFIENAKAPIAKNGISLSNIEAYVTYPIEISKP